MLDRHLEPGYVTADQVRIGDPNEVSNGRRVEVCSAGREGTGAAVLDET